MFKKLALFLFSILISSNAYCGTISVSAFSADSGVSHLESFRTTVVNVINGNIEGSTDGGASVSNIAADSIYEINLGDDANPRIRGAELLGIGSDTTSNQDSFVYTGLVPADSANLTSDISAGTAYINGYRVVKTATSKTYTASMDTYVDLAQNGNYTFSEVTVGSSAPSVASNSARIAKVTTDGTEITSVTDLANRRLPGLIVPSNYRDHFAISFDSTSTLIVTPGAVEINNTIVNKTANESLNIGTAGNWAGGSSLRATSTYGYVGVDSNGNVKLHTTAPTHSNYAVSNTAGNKRYATWSGTVYRVLGWFYMNGTGSGEIESFGISNFRDGNLYNRVYRQSTSPLTVNDTVYGSDIADGTIRFYKSTDRPIYVEYNSGVSPVGNGTLSLIVDINGTDKPGSVRSVLVDGTTISADISLMYSEGLSQGTHTITIQGKDNSGTGRQIDNRSFIVYED